jgi:hypothetical protein
MVAPAPASSSSGSRPNVVDHQIVARLDQINRQIFALLAKPYEAGFHRVIT